MKEMELLPDFFWIISSLTSGVSSKPVCCNAHKKFNFGRV
jgi:hypothetical protein